MVRKKKIIVISSIIVLALIGVIIGVPLKKSSKKQVNILPTVISEKVKKQEMISTIQVDGTISFKDKVPVYAKNSGKIKSILAKEGQELNEGEVVVEYEKSDFENLQRQLEDAKLSLKAAKLNLESLQMPADETELKQLEVQLTQNEKNVEDTKNSIEKLEKNFDKAKIDFENAKILYAQGAIALNEYNNFETLLKDFENQKISAQNSLQVAIEQLEANKLKYETTKNKSKDSNFKNKVESQKISVEQAELRVSQLTKEINKFEINSVSPSFGTVIKINVTEGESVTEGKVIAEIGNLNDLIVEAYIPEYDMKGIKVGQEVKIKVDSNTDDLKGAITKVYPLAEKRNIGGSEKNVVKIEISAPANAYLKAGYTAKLSIITNIDENALVIPIMAYMTQTDADPYVFVIKEDTTLEKRIIKLKSFQGSVTSVEGLAEGESIVATPSDALLEGMKVNILEQPAGGIAIPNATGDNIKESTKNSDLF